MDRDEIDEMLARSGVGVLAMVENEEPYAIPMSFGYDADQMVFAMQWVGDSLNRKYQAVESNSNVC